MKKPRVRKLRTTGSGAVYVCESKRPSRCGTHEVERFGYGNTPFRAYYAWLTGKNLLGAFA